MSLKRFVITGLVAAGVFVGAQGCSLLGADPDAKEERICTPGANVFCRCADTSRGTKLCADDGKSFATACATNENRTECVGGEIDDPDTGKEVDERGNPVDPIDDDAGSGTKPTGSLTACPGQPLSLGAQELVIDGDTSGAPDNAKGRAGACAAGAGGGEHVYVITPTGSGSVSIKVQGEGAYNPTVYLRTNCGDENTQVRCSETTGAGGLEQFQHNMVAGTPYYLFVDGASGSAGKYKITAKLTPGPFCGDGKVSENEACDDKNNVDNDGCDPSCQKVNGDPTTSSACPGQPVHVWPGKTVTGVGSTLSGGTAWSKTGSSCTISTSDVNVANEHVYAVTAHAAGKLTVTATPTGSPFNLMLVARKICTEATPSSQLACANDYGNGDATPETIQVPVTSGETVYVAVDGVLNGKGNYSISFAIQ